ncbi:hypothetical protein J4E86_010413 [Alternaria arbusti]|uniref:uncharacterized protein n=1 Tax=Alternaria arbusti TaxID=232088 RepID=UPI00221ED63D|nr:uncharacterized protein J4E86_010413 [Alternaria arbusti]KAI4941381.1 hypothetical protein J4E86_010413 [Alternaria arbusti]
MPPKKKTTVAEGGEAKGGAFRWTLENEKKLLILTQGRYLTAEDYERIVGVFPGTSIKGVQVRVSLLRVEQRKLYEEYGWTLPEGGAKAKTPVTTPRKTPLSKKRGAGVVEGDGDGLEDGGEEAATPSKKPRGKKGAGKAKGKKEESVEDAVEEDGSEEGGGGKSVGVKEEVLDEELDEMV